MSGPITWSVFTKPWQTLDGAAAGRLLADLGVTGAEVPIRPTAHVTPDTARTLLPRFAAELAEHGVKIISVASDLTESTFAAAAAAGVPMVRIMAPLADQDYRRGVAETRATLEAVAGLVDRYGVQVGVQPHHGRYVTSTLGVLDLLDGLPPGFRLVWDAGHDALAGDDHDVTLRLALPRLGLVNLKNAVYERLEGVGPPRWRHRWVRGPQGLSDWPRALTTLQELGYTGPICLCAEYSTEPDVTQALRADLAYARGQWATESAPDQ